MQTLAEDSVDPSPAIVAMIGDMLVEEAKRRVFHFDWMSLAGGETWETIAGQWSFNVYRIYDAMIAWMGPGADSAFLDLYVLAEGKLPPMKLRSEWYYQGQGMEHWSYVHPDNGWTHGHGVLSSQQLPSNRSTIAEERKRFPGRLLRAVHERGESSLWQAVTLRNMWIEAMNDGQRQDVVFHAILAPLPDYRTALMGELATPWEKPKAIPTEFVKPTSVVRRP